jgi:O-antigen/teichoic acid export membrane protein
VENGIYAAGVRVAELMSAIAPVVQSVTLPGLVELQRRGEDCEFDRAVVDSFLLMAVPAGMIAAVMVGWGDRVVVLAFGSEFAPVTTVVAILAVAQWLALGGAAFASAALALDRRAVLVHTTVLGAAVNVLGNLVFLPGYGRYAAAWASLAAYAIASAFIPITTPRLRSSGLAAARAGIPILAAMLATGAIGRHLTANPLVGLLITTILFPLLTAAMLPRRTMQVIHWITGGFGLERRRAAESPDDVPKF